MAVVPDDDLGRISDEEEQYPPRSQTPPTPPDNHQPSPSPPVPIRQRAMAQLRPVSIPNIVSDMAGTDSLQRIADFDRHYMPDGQPAAETSLCGNSDEHRSCVMLRSAWKRMGMRLQNTGQIAKARLWLLIASGAAELSP